MHTETMQCLIEGVQGDGSPSAGVWGVPRKHYIFLPAPRSGASASLKCYLAVLLGVILCLLSISTVSAHTTVGGSGRISGQLLDGTNKNVPLAGQSVTLQIAQGASAQDAASATTDAQGSFTFANLATDKTISYAVYIRYQGAQYTSNLVSLGEKPAQQLNLTVYEATTSAAKVAVVDATVLIREPSAHSGIFTVSEVYAFKNLDTHAYVGSLDASKGKPNALLFPLPTGARNVRLSSGFDGYRSIQVNEGFATDAALPPGDTAFAFSFDVPYSTASYNFSYTPLYPTVALSVLVPPDLHVNPHGLSPQGIITASDQHEYQNFKASTLLPKQIVQLALEGLIAPAAASAATPLNLGGLWLIVGLLAMAAIIFVTAFINRFQHRKEFRNAKSGWKGPRRHDEKHHEHSSAPKSSRQDKKEELLHELLALDKAHEAGKLSKTAYQERRAKIKARLRTLMSEEEARRK